VFPRQRKSKKALALLIAGSTSHFSPRPSLQLPRRDSLLILAPKRTRASSSKWSPLRPPSIPCAWLRIAGVTFKHQKEKTYRREMGRAIMIDREVVLRQASTGLAGYGDDTQGRAFCGGRRVSRVHGRYLPQQQRSLVLLQCQDRHAVCRVPHWV